MSHAEFTIAATHPGLPGHFPHHPVVPGVVMLDRVIEVVETAAGSRVIAIQRCKFVRPLLPEQACSIDWTRSDDSVRFVCSHADDMLAKGTFKVADG